LASLTDANREQTNRTLSGTSHTLAYDYEGQMTSTTVGGSTQSSFVYDALGRRYSRANGGTTTVLFRDPVHGDQVLCEKQGG
jgi:YD repeat-containing protein